MVGVERLERTVLVTAPHLCWEIISSGRLKKRLHSLAAHRDGRLERRRWLSWQANSAVS